jgi:hypothetical protein
LDCVKIAHEWRKLHGEEHYKLRLLPAVVRVILVDRGGNRCQDNIKMGLGEIDCKCLNCIEFLRNVTSVNAVMSLRVA